MFCIDDNTTATEVDTGCSPELPNCDDDGRYQCFEFLCDTENEVHPNCPQTQPYCQKAKDGFGSFCFSCKNNQGDEKKVDIGCNGTQDTINEPIRCDAPKDGYGSECVVCRNDFPVRGPGDVNGDDLEKGEIPNDFGCWNDAFPNCAADPGQVGFECVFCINDNTNDTGVDTGCSSEVPNCNGGWEGGYPVF